MLQIQQEMICFRLYMGHPVGTCSSIIENYQKLYPHFLLHFFVLLLKDPLGFLLLYTHQINTHLIYSQVQTTYSERFYKKKKHPSLTQMKLK